MVYRRRVRKRLTKRKVNYFNRNSRRHKFGKIQNHIHRYVRWSQSDATFPDNAHGPPVIYSQNTDQHFSYSFNMRNVVNSVDFQSLYDMYKINKVTLYLERVRNVTADGTNNPYNFKCAIIHDYNDNDLLINQNDYLEYANCKRYSIIGNGTIKVTLYPKIANKVENILGGTAFEAVSSNKTWLNTVNDQVPHFGIKVFVPGGVTTAGYSLFTVRAKFDMSFKNSK